jgi:hypothetical protein
MEWDRPNQGLYADGSLRIITSRGADGSIGACHQASAEEVRWVLQMEELEAQRRPVCPRAALERGIIESLLGDPNYEYDVGTDADYCTPLTDRLHKLVQAARGQDTSWHSPKDMLPDEGAIVCCLLRHHGTGTMRQDPLRRVIESDVDFRTLDDFELGYDWEILAWRPMP